MTVIPMEKDLELGMDADSPDLESVSAMDRLSLVALALADDGIEPTFEALNTWMLDQGLRSVDYHLYTDWAGASRAGDRDQEQAAWDP